jgi:CheY-like chemotaxis protein
MEGIPLGIEYAHHENHACARGKRDRDMLANPELRILVVDDYVESARTMGRLLELFGYEVFLAHDGVNAVDCATVFLPSLALIDLSLPDVDGFEVARRLRANPATRNTLLAAVTGYGDEETHARTADAGFAYHLVKPVSVDALLDLLSELPRGPVVPNRAAFTRGARRQKTDR